MKLLLSCDSKTGQTLLSSLSIHCCVDPPEEEEEDEWTEFCWICVRHEVLYVDIV
jgi:hypothetical protein